MEEKKAKRKKLIKKIVIGLLIFALANYIIYLCVASPIMMNVLKNKGIKKDTSEEAMSNYLIEDCEYDLTGFESHYEIEELTLSSDDCMEPHDIPAYYIYAEGVTTKDAPTVIMVHGMSASHICTYPYAELFLERGYNVLTYDQHSFGESDVEYVSYGFYESNDFLACLQEVINNQSEDRLIGVWGQSMGGATIENAMDMDLVKENVDFLVLDCPMGGIKEVTHADPVHNFTTSLLNKAVMGYSFNEQSPYDQVEGNSIPVMIVVAGEDATVSQASYDKNIEALSQNSNGFTYVSPESEHARVYYDNPLAYEGALDEFFIDTVGIE